MIRLFHGERKKQGSSPGTLVHVGHRHLEDVSMGLIEYDEQGCSERSLETVEAAFPSLDGPRITWLNVVGLHDTAVIEDLGRHLDVHPLVLEDILNTAQRPKLEDYDHYLFIVLRMFDKEAERDELQWEQVSIIVKGGIVVTFQEKPGDVLEPVRERIRAGKGRIRTMGADYLVYAIMDAVVDAYFGVLESVGERVDGLEADLIDEELDADPLQDLHRLRRHLIFLKKAVWPLREVVNSIYRGESSLFGRDTRVFVRDLYDHTIQVIETIETLRDMVTGMQDLHLSVVSNRMNRVMQFLAVIGTVFIPLTFVAGIYGMNFEYMPELHWRWSYPLLLALMVIMVGGMLLIFRRKRWL